MDDLSLCKLILAGDDEAWREFVERHTPFIKRVLHRYAPDGDIATDLYISLLESLKRSRLSRFKGRSALTTWLFIVARNHCRDYLRSKSGVRHIQTIISGLDAFDRRFFELCYIQAMPMNQALAAMRAEMGKEVSYLDLIESRSRIGLFVRKKGFGRMLEKLLEPKHPRDVPVRDMDEFYSEFAGRLESAFQDGESVTARNDLEEVVRSFREAVMLLSPRDRLLLRMRFVNMESARRICSLLGFTNEKQVYRRLEKVYEDIRAALRKGGIERPMCMELIQNLDIVCSLEDVWGDGRQRRFH